MVNNKTILKCLFLTSIFLGSSAIGSEFLLRVRPYAGIDAQWKHMGFKKGFGDNLFRKNVPQGNLYFGFNFNDYWAIEAGYESTLNMNKTVILSPGSIGPGFNIPDGDPTEGNHFKSKFRGWHVNFLAFSPYLSVDNSVRLFAGVGFSHKRLVLIQSPFSSNSTLLSQSDIDAYRRTFTQRKSLLRLSAGVQKMLNDNWGLRAIINWENTSKFSNLKPKEKLGGVTTASAKDSMSVGLGFFTKL